MTKVKKCKSGHRARTSPGHVPMSAKTVTDAYTKGVRVGITGAYAIVLMLLQDSYGFDKEQLHELWRRASTWSDDIAADPALLVDIRQTLIDEYGIDLK